MMFKDMTPYSVAEVLEKLNSKGFVIDSELPDFVITQHRKKERPLYLRTLVGVGAFFASLCFILFLEASGIINFNPEEGFITGGLGLIFVAGAIVLQRFAGHNNTFKHSLFIQSSFASMAVGKVLFTVGISYLLDSKWGTTLGLFIITGTTYYIYRMSIDRFLSAFAVLLSILLNILWHGGEWSALFFNGFFLLQFAGTAILHTHGKIKRGEIPLSYAFAFSLCASVLFLASHMEFGSGKDKELIHPVFVNMMLTVGLVAVFGWAAGGIKKLKAEPLVFASIGAVLLGSISAPGILLTIGLLVLGYAKHEKLLIYVGTLLLPVFLFLYYYNLDTSLLQKSGILIGSGAVLLAGNFLLIHKGWNAKGTSCVQK